MRRIVVWGLASLALGLTAPATWANACGPSPSAASTHKAAATAAASRPQKLTPANFAALGAKSRATTVSSVGGTPVSFSTGSQGASAKAAAEHHDAAALLQK